jgi:hypothetical protein
MTISAGCHRCGRLWGFRAEHLARHSELAEGGWCARPSARWVWVISVRDSQNIFANVDSQRAFEANNSDYVW